MNDIAAYTSWCQANRLITSNHYRQRWPLYFFISRIFVANTERLSSIDNPLKKVDVVTYCSFKELEKRMIKKKINRLFNRYLQKKANFLFRSIVATPPINSNPKSDTIFYCALGKNACRQYIAMAKSFLRYTKNVAVVAQDDGTLESRHVREIESHIIGGRVFRKDEMLKIIREKAGPELLSLLPSEKEYEYYTSVKIMYLKFLNVICRFNGKKVIIVDSDLLFLRKPNEIVHWIEQPYTNDFYSEGANAKSEDFYAMGFKFRSLDIANFSSGTIGVGGFVTQDQLEYIFQRIRDYDPSLFYAWEIEQALWSVVMSERENPLNIDDLRDIYVGSGWKSYQLLKEKAILAHFAGVVRFNNLRYLRLLWDLVKDLKSTNSG